MQLPLLRLPLLLLLSRGRLMLLRCLLILFPLLLLSRLNLFAFGWKCLCCIIWCCSTLRCCWAFNERPRQHSSIV
jgi:hypothetical protein